MLTRIKRSKNSHRGRFILCNLVIPCGRSLSVLAYQWMT